MTGEPWALEPLDPAVLAETIDALTDRLAAQEEMLTAVVARLDREQPAAGRWNRREADDSRTTELDAELATWVDWLVARYQLVHSRYQVPPCWAQHPVAVEELTALMVAWQASYTGQSATGDALIAWHDRWLWPCLTRLNEGLQVWNGCRAGRHQG